MAWNDRHALMKPAACWSLLPLWLLAGVLALGSSAWAQVADVMTPDSRGDFRSPLVSGPRGAYPQRYWLVVDRDPQGLWCRDAFWRPAVALRSGAVLELDLRDPQQPSLLQHRGAPYLRVRVKPMDILVDARLGERGKELSCVVRANVNFLAPIHPDSLESVRLRP